MAAVHVAVLALLQSTGSDTCYSVLYLLKVLKVLKCSMSSLALLSGPVHVSMFLTPGPLESSPFDLHHTDQRTVDHMAWLYLHL